MEYFHAGWLWFNVFLAVLLALDLGVFNRKAHHITAKEAAIWTGIWVSLAAVFNAGVYFYMGTQSGLEWTTGYLIEKALSVDNVFVFAVLISAFAVPDEYRHRLLFLGVIGALVMRLSLIVAGAYLLEHWHWLFYVFGFLLIFTGWRMFASEEELSPERQPLLKWLLRKLPVSNNYEGAKLITHVDGRRVATPFLLALIAVETSDLIFAVDSIPAVFAITSDPFIVYSSNAMAILGLRSLYFVLADAMQKFHYLKHGLGVILMLVGVKMTVKDFVHIAPLWSLAVIVLVLGVSIYYSLKRPIPREGASEPKKELVGKP